MVNALREEGGLPVGQRLDAQEEIFTFETQTQLIVALSKQHRFRGKRCAQHVDNLKHQVIIKNVIL